MQEYNETVNGNYRLSIVMVNSDGQIVLKAIICRFFPLTAAYICQVKFPFHLETESLFSLVSVFGLYWLQRPSLIALKKLW